MDWNWWKGKSYRMSINVYHLRGARAEWGMLGLGQRTVHVYVKLCFVERGTAFLRGEVIAVSSLGSNFACLGE